MKQGDIYRVGDSHWVKDEDFIGFTRDAKHGHGLKRGGSFGIGTKVVVLQVLDDNSCDVSLIRSDLPFGAQAPHGIIFTLSQDTIRGWASNIEAAAKKEKDRSKRMQAYSRLSLGELLEEKDKETFTLNLRKPSLWCQFKSWWMEYVER